MKAWSQDLGHNGAPQPIRKDRAATDRGHAGMRDGEGAKGHIVWGAQELELFNKEKGRLTGAPSCMKRCDPNLFWVVPGAELKPGGELRGGGFFNE